MAKTDWGMNDIVMPADMNDIGEEINQLRTDVDNIHIPPATLTEAGIVQLSNKTDGTSETLAATEKAVSDVKNASVPRSGGVNMTGRLIMQQWGDFSADTGGSVLFGSNCYLDPNVGQSGSIFRFENTHADLGARGIYMRYAGTPVAEVYMFDTGPIAATAGQAFTPTLKRMVNMDDIMQPNDNPTSNIIWNSTGLFGLEGWTNVGEFPLLTSTSADVTGLFYTNDAVPKNRYAVLDSMNINVYAGVQYDLQSMFFSSGSYPDTVVHIEVKNVANSDTLFVLASDPQKWWHRKKMSFTVPTGVSQIKLRLVVTNAPTGVTKGFARIRLNLRNVATKDVPYDFTGDVAYIAGELQAVKQSGVDAKNGIVGAINAKGGSASTNDTWAQLADKIRLLSMFKAGDNSLKMLDSGGSTYSTSPAMGSYFKPSVGGTFRVSYTLFASHDINGASAYAQIYVNGVPRGPQRSVNNNTGGQRFKEDVTINTGDAIQLYLWSSNSQNIASVSFFDLASDFNVQTGS